MLHTGSKKAEQLFLFEWLSFVTRQAGDDALRLAVSQVDHFL